jgi:hypothetical protein
LTNVYLPYLFDLRVQHWRKTEANDDAIVVRRADNGIFYLGLEIERKTVLVEMLFVKI